VPPQASAAWDSLRRATHSTTEDTANRAARLVSSIPDERIEQLMRTPARHVVVEAIFLLMPRYLNRARATGVNLAIRWRVTPPGGRGDADVYDLVVADRHCRIIRRGRGPAPLVTITLEATELLRLATGRVSPMQSYFDGKLQLRGDIMQAARLTAVFRIPDAGRT
jgi:alkyl sulfatase BDS1-like metallo-beta-lactamase superfamily hydrolase